MFENVRVALVLFATWKTSLYALSIDKCNATKPFQYFSTSVHSIAQRKNFFCWTNSQSNGITANSTKDSSVLWTLNFKPTIPLVPFEHENEKEKNKVKFMSCHRLAFSNELNLYSNFTGRTQTSWYEDLIVLKLRSFV